MRVRNCKEGIDKAVTGGDIILHTKAKETIVLLILRMIQKTHLKLRNHKRYRLLVFKNDQYYVEFAFYTNSLQEKRFQRHQRHVNSIKLVAL